MLRHFCKEKTIKGLVKKLEDMKHLSNEQGQSLTSNFGHMTKELLKKSQNLPGIPTQSSNLWSHCTSTALKHTNMFAKYFTCLTTPINCEPGFFD